MNEKLRVVVCAVWLIESVVYSAACLTESRDRIANWAARDVIRTFAHIRMHIEQALRLVPLSNAGGIEASADRGTVGLRKPVTLSGASTSGPVQAALADVATYAVIPAAKIRAAVAVDLTINFLRHADVDRDC